MAETSAIEWTDATVNFWWGCTKVGPGCDHCYAETLNAFRGNGVWGHGAPRRKIKGAHALLAKLNRTAWRETHGHRIRVFMSSMGDLFDNEVDPEWRMEAYHAAAAATNLDIQFLTKRVSNVEKMIPREWFGNWPRHIGLMITVVNQAEADRDVPRLLALKAANNIPWIGLSIEPLLGPIDFREMLRDIDWVIVGGESGKGARPMHPDWVSKIKNDCGWAGTPFLFKQWGEWGPADDWPSESQEDYELRGLAQGNMLRVGKKNAGRLLDGIEHNGFPKAFDRRPA